MIDFSMLARVVLNSAIVYFLLVLLTRFIGKKLIGQLTFFDFVTGITIGTIGGAFVTHEVPGYYDLISAVIIAILAVLTGILTLKSSYVRKLTKGEPTIVIQEGRVCKENMKKIRYNLDDLMMQLRERDIFDIDEVESAILETHGKLSVLKKSEYQAVTRKDLNILSPKKGLSTDVIKDGRIEDGILRQNNLSYEWLYNELFLQGVNKVEDVFLASLSSNGNLYISLKEEKENIAQNNEQEPYLMN